jgi:predicted nucleic acid-binding protein
MIDVMLVPEPADVPPECGRLPDKDRPILAAAMASEATHLLTGDLTHFDRLYGKTVGGVCILRPADYLESRYRRSRRR